MRLFVHLLAAALAGLAPVVANAQFFYLAELRSPHPEADSHFGAAIAEGGSALVVGQPDASYGAYDKVGAVYLYDYIHYDAPVELRPALTYANAHYGAAVASQVLVGAPGGSAVAADPAPRGVVESWQPSGDFSWTRDGILAPPDDASGSGFGTSVSEMSYQVVVGYPGYLDGDREAGAAMQYHWNQDWQYDGSFISSHDGTGFGRVVVVAGGRILVGEPGFNDGTGATGLIAYYDGGLPAGALMAGDGEAQGFGGSAIWINGILLVGVPYPSDFEGHPIAGRVYVYSRDFQTGDYVQTQILSAPDGFPGDGFGSAIDMFGFTYAIGTPGMSVRGHANAGAVWLFDGIGFELRPRERKISPYPATNGRFGEALAWTFGRLGVGAPGEPDGALAEAGAVYVFGHEAGIIFQGYFDTDF